jgi:hypothetical protein
MATLQTFRRVCVTGLVVWALIFVTPLFMILRELVGPAREVFNWTMWTLPFILLAGALMATLVVQLANKRSLPKARQRVRGPIIPPSGRL